MSVFSLNVLKFEDVKYNIIEFLKSNSEYHATFDFEGANLNYIVDAMAYVSMQMSYQVANVANNIFLDSTEIRKNAVSIAKTIGYRPRRITPSRSDISITYTDTTAVFDPSSYIKILPNTYFKSDKGHYYLNSVPIILEYKDINTLVANNIIVNQGLIKEYTQISNGVPFQSIIISSNKVSELGFQLSIQDSITENPSSLIWNELANTYSLQDKNSYLVEEDTANEGYVKVLFGDGTILNYPEKGKLIKIRYQEAEGENTNGEFLTRIPEDLSAYETNILKFPTNLSSLQKNMTLISNKTYNGKAYEDIDSIRNNAPMFYANYGRLVTEADYNSFLKTYRHLSKARAIGGDVLFPGDTTKLGNIYITGLPSTFDGTNLQSLYLSSSQEAELSNDVMKFRIISTRINFFKPSYIYMDLTPYVEIDKHSSEMTKINVSNQVQEILKDHVDHHFNDFGISIRDTKVKSSLEVVSEAISTSIKYEYSFLISKDSFYGMYNDVIDLPIIIRSYDSNYNVAVSESFIRNNTEQRIYLGFPNEVYDDHDFDNFYKYDFTKDMSTIYGKIYHPTLNRYIYNVDKDNGTACDIILTAENTIASIFHYENHSNPSMITNLVSGTDTNGNQLLNLNLSILTDGTSADTPYINNPSVSGYYDQYIATTPAGTAGVVYRTDSYAQGFLGFVRRSTDIPFLGSPGASGGAFMESVVNIWINDHPDMWLDGFGEEAEEHPAVGELRKGDFIVFDTLSPTASPQYNKWVHARIKDTVSAVSGINFYDTVPASALSNLVYEVSAGAVPGNINGLLLDSVSAGDAIIFNYNSIVNPYNKWEIVKERYSGEDIPVNGMLPASADLPVITTPFDLRVVSNVEVSTTFGGKTDLTFAEQDLIYYDSSSASAEKYKWKRVINLDNNSVTALPNISATSNALDTLSIPPSAIGTVESYYVVSGDPGNFSDSERVNWPFSVTGSDQYAVAGDILICTSSVSAIGSWINTWNIYLQEYSNLYVIDGSNENSLPISASYGDKFTVSASGTFNGYFNEILNVGDSVIYITNNWIKYLPAGYLYTAYGVAAQSLLPIPGTVGDMLRVIEEGDFSNNTIPNIISPSGDKFVEGDLIIFTGNSWTKAREYSFSYTNGNVSKQHLNDIGLSSVFDYNFDNDTGRYNIIFKDKYDGATVGSLIYSSSTDFSRVGKLILSQTISGYTSMNAPPDIIKTLDLFDSTPNKINILPSIRSDYSVETDFDTFFDNYIIGNVKTPIITKTVI